MSSNQCIATTATGAQCTRRAVIDGLCTQHYNILNKHETKDKDNDTKLQISLPDVLTNYILSDYIEYDILKELQNEFDNLYIDPKRTVIKKYDKYLENMFAEFSISYTERKKGYNYNIVETYIDSKLRKQEYFSIQNQIKIIEYNYNKDEEMDGPQYSWYVNGNMQSIENFKNGKTEGWQYNYHDNGMLENKINTSNGKYNGLYYSWYSNGKISSFINFKDNYKYGDYYDFYINKNGKGITYRFHEDGTAIISKDITAAAAEKIHDEYTKIMYPEFLEGMIKKIPPTSKI
jgi:antitoxin component YwqK of YwqJK toxin-antitoxin module